MATRHWSNGYRPACGSMPDFWQASTNPAEVTCTRCRRLLPKLTPFQAGLMAYSGKTVISIADTTSAVAFYMGDLMSCIRSVAGV